MDEGFRFELGSVSTSSMKGKKKRPEKAEKEREAARRIFKGEAATQLRARLYPSAFTSITKKTSNWTSGEAVYMMTSSLVTRVARDTELMQSFLRTGVEVAEPLHSQEEPTKKKKEVQLAPASWLLSKELRQKRRPRRRRQEEVYTDKDRAAAVNIGTRYLSLSRKDIKQSLRLKKKEERSKALQIPEETRPETLLALAGYEVRARRHQLAFLFITKAIDLNPEDKSALVERSKCYILLGEPALALKDAEAALAGDHSYSKGLLQKAESLYHLGRFEEALVFFHRGLKVRPDMAGFRLGVAKSTEAIQNIIGSESTAFSGSPESLAMLLKGLRTVEDVVQAAGQRQADTKRALLRPLRLEKDYLENLLTNKSDVLNIPEPFALNETELHAREILTYLNARSHFWSQQRP